MIKAYRHLYEKMDIRTVDGSPIGVGWVIKRLDKPWYEHLTPGHRKFYDSLEGIEQLMISMSCDPFNALKYAHQTRKAKS